MSSSSSLSVFHTTKIPQEFYNSDTATLFSKCIACDKHLLDPDVHYIIEKAIKQYPEYRTQDIIFEYAMCLDCAMMIEQSFSAESKQKVDQYFEQNAGFLEKRLELIKENSKDYKKWISRCVVKNTPCDSLTEYQLVCQCQGDKMLLTHLPFLIGGEAIDEISDLLSNQTIGEINGFYDRFFPVPPELKPLFEDRPVLIF